MGFKGIDEKSSPTAIADGRAVEAQNVQFTLTGGLSKRDGYSLEVMLDTNRTGDDLEVVTGLWELYKSTGTRVNLAVNGDRIYSWSTGTKTDITSSEVIASGITVDNQYVWTTALDYAIGTNEVDPPFKSNGTTTSILALNFSDGKDFTAKCVAWWKNYLIFGNTVENSTHRATRIRWSNVGYIETWSDDDYLDIDALGGQEIEGFGLLHDNFYIFLTDSVYKVSYVGGDEIIVASKVSEGTGCIAKNSIQNITLPTGQSGLVFLSKDKTINFTDGINLTNIALLIDDTMDGLNASRLQYAVSAEDGSDYYLAVTDGAVGTNNLLLDFNFDIGEWSTHTQIDANAMAKIVDSSGNIQIYSGNYDSFIYKLFDTALTNDVAGQTGTFEAVSIYDTKTASSLQVIYDDEANFTCTGATVRIISGTGLAEEKVIVAVTSAVIPTGIVVDSAFTTTPDTTSIYSIGDIDADYITKWYDLGEPARRKQFGELYLWADEAGNMAIDISYAQDFSGYIDTQSVSLKGAGDLWGVGIWGTAKWGGQEALFKIVKLKGSGRYIRLKISEDDLNETFDLFSYNFLYWTGDIQ